VHVAGLAHVFNAGPKAELLFTQVNEDGTRNVAAAAAKAGVEHLVVISSVSVYGKHLARGCDETERCEPFGSYAKSKYNAELRALEVSAQTGLKVTILRLATLCGEGDPGNVGRLIQALERGRFIWIGRGDNRKSLLYACDAARACVAALRRPPKSPEIYNVSGPAITMREIVEALSSDLGKTPPRLSLPAPLLLGAARVFAGCGFSKGRFVLLSLRKWLADDVYSAEKIREQLGFTAETSIRDALQREVKWYREQGVRK